MLLMLLLLFITMLPYLTVNSAFVLFIVAYMHPNFVGLLTCQY